MSITRRVFLRNGAMAIVGTTAIPGFLTRAAFGAELAGDKKKRLVVIFQRGAADGLNIVVPHGEPAYYSMRPSINIPRSAVIDLDGSSDFIPRCQHSSRSGVSAIWRLCTQPARPIQRAHILMRRISWSLARPV